MASLKVLLKVTAAKLQRGNKSMNTEYMTYTAAQYILSANDAKRLKVFVEQVASTSIESFAVIYKRIAKKIVADCGFQLTAVEFNMIVSDLGDFSELFDLEQIRDHLIIQAPSLSAYSPEVMAISIINEDAPDVDCAWLYDLHNDKMDDYITFSECYRMTQGFIRGLIAARLVGIEVISDLDRSMRICGGFRRMNKVL